MRLLKFAIAVMVVLAISMGGIGMCMKTKAEQSGRVEDALPVDPMESMVGKLFKFAGFVLAVVIIYSIVKAMSGIRSIASRNVSDDIRPLYDSVMRKMEKKEKVIDDPGRIDLRS